MAFDSGTQIDPNNYLEGGVGIAKIFNVIVTIRRCAVIKATHHTNIFCLFSLSFLLSLKYGSSLYLLCTIENSYPNLSSFYCYLGPGDQVERH